MFRGVAFFDGYTRESSSTWWLFLLQGLWLFRWYPGERRGYEFVYPEEQAQRLAQGASQLVLTTQTQTTTTAQTHSPDLTRVSSGRSRM